jgi:hypothetical protein
MPRRNDLRVQFSNLQLFPSNYLTETRSRAKEGLKQRGMPKFETRGGSEEIADALI